MFPTIVEQNLEKLISTQDLSVLRGEYGKISELYRRQVFQKDISLTQAIAYACARMPATYAVINKVLTEFQKKAGNFPFDSVLDVGSGTGALMCSFLSEKPTYTAVEKSKNMKKIAEKIIEGSKLNVDFLETDIASFFAEERTFGSSFFVYSLNEMPNKEEVLAKVLRMSRDFLFIIEPGTPFGYKNILLAKELAKKTGCEIIAPCACSQCPLKPDDWCHFSVRLPRTKFHTFIKDADLQFEDEKFSYIIIAKNSVDKTTKNRIIKRPIKRKGHTIFDVCTNMGVQRIFASNKRLKQKLDWGDELELTP